jgi:hypothetical protein
MSQFTVDTQTLLYLKSALIDLRVRSAACPGCGRDADHTPHSPDCPLDGSMRLVDSMLSEEYQQVFTRAWFRRKELGPLRVHWCAALDHGPAWARRERLLVDADPTGSIHAHLFRERDGKFHVSVKDRRRLPEDLAANLEARVNSVVVRACAGSVGLEIQ